MLEQTGQVAVKIACPPGVVPSPGQFVMARCPSDTGAALGEIIFSAGDWEGGFIAAPPIPFGWGLGSSLILHGPQGHGFHLPASAHRLAIAVVSDTAARVAPLARLAHDRKLEVALFTDAPMPALPVSVEAYPLAALPDVLRWADLLALDLPLYRLKELRSLLALRQHDRLPCPAQALLITPMPCLGLAECAACAVPSRNGQLLACLDGPVFDLNLLEW